MISLVGALDAARNSVVPCSVFTAEKQSAQNVCGTEVEKPTQDQDLALNSSGEAQTRKEAGDASSMEGMRELCGVPRESEAKGLCVFAYLESQETRTAVWLDSRSLIGPSV